MKNGAEAMGFRAFSVKGMEYVCLHTFRLCSVVPFDTAKGTESRPGRNRKRRFPPDPHPYPAPWNAAAMGRLRLLRIALNFRFQRKQSIAKSTYAICIGFGAAANVERGALPELSTIFHLLGCPLCVTSSSHFCGFMQACVSFNPQPLSFMHSGRILFSSIPRRYAR